MIAISLADFHLQPVAELQDKWGAETRIEDYIGLVPTNSLQTPTGIRVLHELAKATGDGIIAGITANKLGDKCDKLATFSKTLWITKH